MINIVPIVLAAAITGGVLLLVVCPLAIFAMVKSSHRKEEKLERRESLRRSIRANSTRSAVSMTTTKAASEGDEVRRQRPPMHSLKNKFLDLSGVTMDDSSTDSAFKAKFDFHRPSTPASSLSQSKPDESSYFDSDLGPVHRAGEGRGPPRLENEIPSTSARVPSYGGWNNSSFVDDSFNASVAGLEPARRSGDAFGGRPLSRYSQEPGPSRGYRVPNGSQFQPVDSAGYRASAESYSSPSGSSGAKGPKSKPPRPKPNETAI